MQRKKKTNRSLQFHGVEGEGGVGRSYKFEYILLKKTTPIFIYDWKLKVPVAIPSNKILKRPKSVTVFIIYKVNLDNIRFLGII